MPRLLFIAMSGVRIVDPKLRELGLTLPGFVERGKVIASMPSLGLLTLAGATPDSWYIEYHEIDDLTELQLDVLVNIQRPDLVAISSLSARIHDAYAISQRFRNAGATTIIGGLHASVLPNEAGQFADVVVTGQAEWIWPQILDDFLESRLKKVYSGLHVRDTLDSAPLPRYDLLDPRRYNRIPLQTSRGCPLDCSYCAASRLISPYKRKSIDRIHQELESILNLWEKPFVELADDNTFINKTWSRELTQVFAQYPQVRWFTETDISLADDEYLLELLASSGCAQVLIGLESVSGEALLNTDTGKWKRRQLESYAQKIEKIQSYGISVNGCFIFGFDSDTPETFARTWDFIQESQLSEVQITILTPFPGTALHRTLSAQGRLLKETFWDQCTLFDVTYRPQNFTPEGLADHFAQMMATVYSDEATMHRSAIRNRLHRIRQTSSSRMVSESH